ncbi:MAG: MerR family transcriptional regulator [Eggerthellaceae bacterium]|nr:MerR family transcriptional regulator [Eggerthellaceae bacterium]
MDQMSCTVSQLADAAGVSVRTLRYYGQIGLLTPERSANGYRTYGQDEVRRLQHIMLLRSCGLALADIGSVLSSDEPDLEALLRDHLSRLEQQAQQLAQTIRTTKVALDGLEEFYNMNDAERFEKLKRDSVQRFEEEFGEESRALYGDDVIDEANQRMLSMSKLAWDAKEELEQRVKDALTQAMATNDPASAEARMCVEMHAQWIRVHWGEGAYTPEAHVQLANGYLADPRFIEYYDSACGEGATEFLVRAIETNIH